MISETAEALHRERARYSEQSQELQQLQDALATARKEGVQQGQVRSPFNPGVLLLGLNRADYVCADLSDSLQNQGAGRLLEQVERLRTSSSIQAREQAGMHAATQQRAEQAEAQILLLQREGQVHDSNSNSNPPATVEH